MNVFTITCDWQLKVLPNGDLLISRISWEDMGSYTCIAQNSLGQDKVESFVYPVRKEGIIPLILF